MSRNTYFHGVFRNSCYAIDSHTGPRLVVANVDMTARRLLTLAEIHNLSTVWIVPDCALSHVDPDMFCNADEAVWDVRYYKTEGSTRQLPRMKRMVAWRRYGSFDDKRSIEITWIEQGTWGWEEGDPSIVLQAILQLTLKLRVTIDAHPGSVGRAIMKGEVQKDHQVVPRVDLSQLPSKCARDFAWKQPLEAGEHEGMFLHAYDKNSMYLSAATGASLGVGDPQYYGGANMKTPDTRLAGLWRIEAKRQELTAYRRRELPLGRNSEKLPWPLAEGQEWCTSPVLKCLIEMGADVQVFEGYEWPASRRVLGKWANALFDARMGYRRAQDDPVSSLCAFSMKRIATASVGLLGYGSTVARDVAWKRPDWWSTLIETAKARMLYNIDHYATDYGMLPAMVFVDCLYYVSESSTPNVCLLGRSEELGGYKHKGTWPLTLEVIEWFADEDMSAGEVARKLQAQEEVAHAG